jgi:hypothetical protein
MRTRFTLLATAALTIAVVLPGGVATAHRDRPSGDPEVVRTWNALTVSTLATAGKPPPEQFVYLSYVHAAVYDAVVAIDHGGPQYLLRLRAPQDASADAAVAAAAHGVLVAYFPTQAPTLDAAYAISLAAIADGPAKTDGITVGDQAAAGIVALRAGDGLNGPTIAPLPPGPGVWQPTPPNTQGLDSWLGNVKPFLLDSVASYAPPAPPALTSAEWARDYNETRLYGSATSTVRTPAQTETARFWAAPPIPQQQTALRNLTVQRRLDLHETARLFAINSMAAADSSIVCFAAKYQHEFWRPFTAIPAGDSDNNPATMADPTWVPLLVTPNHPEFPSAHGCATAGALATVLTSFLGTDRINFDVSATVTGTTVTHHFATARQLADEVANARVWGGIHWRFSTSDGTTIGQHVARYDLQHFPHDEDD